MPDAPPGGSSSNRPSTPSDAPPLTPAYRAIVEAAFVGYNLRAGISSPDGDYAHRDRMRAALAAALPLAVEVCCIQPMPAAPDMDQRSYGTGYLAALSHVRQSADALAARLAEAGNE